MAQDERFELPTNLDSQSSALSIELILYIFVAFTLRTRYQVALYLTSVPPRAPQCSFPSIQDLAVDSRFPLITRACQRWKWLHQHFHGKHQLQRRMGDALTSLAASFLSAVRASQGATWILPRRAKPFHSMVYPSGFEPLTDCLEGSCAILLSHGYIYWCPLQDSNLRSHD